MGFEMFAPGRSAADERDIPTLRILSGGRLVLNAAAQGMLGDVAFVQLFWDVDTKRIGIMPSGEDEQDVFRVTATAGQSIITSKTFVETYNLPLSLSMTLAREGRMLVASTTAPRGS